ncbi:MAG: hypothetical protein N3B21_10730 [Clostridia bacterium]|nr:hypothetical protein [Clostridia bacterium]
MPKLKIWGSIGAVVLLSVVWILASNILDNYKLGFEDTADYWVIKYPVTNGIAEYWVNKAPKKADDGKSIQFISHIKYDNVPLTKVPYVNGSSGLVAANCNYGTVNMAFENIWVGELEYKDSKKIIVKYTNSTMDSFITLEFSTELPLVKITSDMTVPKNLSGISVNVSYVFWQAIGGKHNLKNRVVVPKGENEYYVINGQADGIHYLPSNEYWTLRMGEESTPYENITVGFVTKSHKYMTNLGAFFPKPTTWGQWAMGQDLYLDTKNQFGKSFDKVPFDMDKITENIYSTYQEDEANLGYSWIDFFGQTLNLKEGEKLYNEVYLWVGKDRWQGNYGLNYDKVYRFGIDRYQDRLK